MEQDIVKYRYIVEMVLNKLRIYVNRDEYRQVGLIGLWQALAKYDVSICELEPYLYTQVRFHIMDELRRKYRQMEKEVQDVQVFLYLAQNDDMHKSEMELRDLLEELYEEEQQLIKYTYFHGYQVRELAKIFGVAEVTIKKRKKRVLEKLRHLIIEKMLHNSFS